MTHMNLSEIEKTEIRSASMQKAGDLAALARDMLPYLPVYIKSFESVLSDGKFLIWHDVMLAGVWITSEGSLREYAKVANAAREATLKMVERCM